MTQSGGHKGSSGILILRLNIDTLNLGCGLFDCRPEWLQRFANGGFVVALMVGIRWGSKAL